MKIWKLIGYEHYHFWRNPFGKFFHIGIEMTFGWERFDKNNLNIYLNFMLFNLTLFFRRKMLVLK